jgi:hypothetical protein
LGAHIFYRWRGYWGRRAAFTGAYAGETGEIDTGAPFIFGLPKGGAASIGLKVPYMTGPRPLADDIGHLTAGARALTPPMLRPRADREAGVLVVDEKPATLIHLGPKAK